MPHVATSPTDLMLAIGGAAHIDGEHLVQITGGTAGDGPDVATRRNPWSPATRSWTSSDDLTADERMQLRMQIERFANKRG